MEYICVGIIEYQWFLNILFSLSLLDFKCSVIEFRLEQLHSNQASCFMHTENIVCTTTCMHWPARAPTWGPSLYLPIFYTPCFLKTVKYPPWKPTILLTSTLPKTTYMNLQIGHFQYCYMFFNFYLTFLAWMLSYWNVVI